MNPDLLKQLKDIKPPVAVPDHSLWLLLGTAAAAAGLAALAWYLWRRRPARKRRRRKSPRQIAREKLSAIDYTDTKGAVYAFGEYLPALIADDPALTEAFEALQKELEPYKYKKEVPPLAPDHEKAMRRLVKKGLKRG